MKIELSKYEKALEYEIFVKKEYQIIDDIIKNSNIVFDVGGHIGLFSLYCLNLNPLLKIHFFEPVKESFDKARILLDGSSDQIEFNNFGVSNKDYKGTIYLNPTKTMQSSIFNNTFLNKEGVSQNCDFVDINKYIIQEIDLMKIDIEGGEFELLQNLTKIDKIKNLVFEYHLFGDHSLNKLVEYLGNYYNKIDVVGGDYTDKVGIVLCTNI